MVKGDGDMKRGHHTPKRIIRKLLEVDRMLGEDQLVVQGCKHPGITEPHLEAEGISTAVGRPIMRNG